MFQFHFLEQVIAGSTGCPARCEFCDLADLESPVLELKISPLKIKNELIQKWMLISGGDQYLLTDLNSQIQKFQSQGYKVAVTSSGLFFKDRPAEEFVAADLTLIPVFSHVASEHNFWMGIDAFDRLLEIGKTLKRKNKLVIFNQLISRQSIPFLDDISDFWQKQNLFCMLRPRSALVDVPGLARETRPMLQYQAHKPHLYVHPGDRHDAQRLTNCLAGEAWGASGWINRMFDVWGWHALILKSQKYYKI